MSCCDSGFRLAAASECSLRSKARIDALFEDSRSVCSSLAGGGAGWAASLDAGCCSDEDLQRRVNSAVQARIEAMFASVEAESAAPGECAAALLPVKYMGAAPVGGRVASVRGLQEPLRQLAERYRESVSAELEVSRRGLTFRTSELREKNNPFRRIAVWSALRLQARKRQPDRGFVHAFVPLVADGERTGEEAGRAGTPGGEERHAELYRTMRGLPRPAEEYPPIFAVVMRRPGAARLLECHAFACRSEEDAIAAAATLYRALLADLDAMARRPRQRNGLGCASLASVASLGSAASSLRPGPTPAQPVRPPRAKRSPASSSGGRGEEDDEQAWPGQPPRRQKKCSDAKKAEDVLEARNIGIGSSSSSSSSSNNNNNNNNRRASRPRELGPEPEGSSATSRECSCTENSIYESSGTASATVQPAQGAAGTGSAEQRGGLGRVATMDRPLRRRARAGSEPPGTRVTGYAPCPGGHSAAGNGAEDAATAAGYSAVLRRAQSELELTDRPDRGDLLTRVELPRRSSFLKPAGPRKAEGREGAGPGTPLGFTELFDEFRNQEGLTSVDDILAAIIDPEGMSFNELKPLYKEFLLRLAATLSQDELYQRSASIMRRRRRPRRSAGGRGLLRRALRRSVSRLRATAGGAPTEFTSVVFPARRLTERSSRASSSSSAGGSCGGGGGGGGGGSASRPSALGSRRPGQRATSSEDSDAGGPSAPRAPAPAANRSSSGYVSCSECSYDSESCTCVSADKCYCSLSRRPGQPGPGLACSCDTDSCSESNKCYCARSKQPSKPSSILEQLRQKGIVVPAAESGASRAPSPEPRRRPGPGSLGASRSLEYLKVRSPRGSADNLGLDYDLFRPGGARRASRRSSASEKVLVVSARDPQGRLIYVGGGDDGAPGARDGDGRRSSRPGQAAGHHHEALSIKKSAEIAAVFGAGSHARLARRTSSASSLRSSVSLEAGLGYLP